MRKAYARVRIYHEPVVPVPAAVSDLPLGKPEEGGAEGPGVFGAGGAVPADPRQDNQEVMSHVPPNWREREKERNSLYLSSGLLLMVVVVLVRLDPFKK